MQLYKHNTSRDGTHKQAGGRSVDAAQFATSKALRKIRLPNIEKSQKSVKNQLKKLGQRGKSDKQDSPENQELKTGLS